MKILYRISLFFAIVCLGFFCGVFAQKYLGSESNNGVVAKTEVETEIKLEAPKEVSPVVAQNNTITSDTTYVVELYDTARNTQEEVREELPAKYIGMNRTAVEKEIEAYCIAPSLRDQEKGFVSEALISFSPEKMVVRKMYCLQEQEDFYLLVEDNYVVVYESDLQTVFLTTEILLEELPEELQAEIMNLKYVKSEEEVYQFLEAFSN